MAFVVSMRLIGSYQQEKKYVLFTCYAYKIKFVRKNLKFTVIQLNKISTWQQNKFVFGKMKTNIYCEFGILNRKK